MCKVGSTSLPPPPYPPSPCRGGQTVLPPCGSRSCSSSCWLSTGSTLKDASLTTSFSPFFGQPSSLSPMSSGRNIYQTRMGGSSSNMQIPPSSPLPPTPLTRLTPSLPCLRSPLQRRVSAPYPLRFIDAPDSHPSILRDSDGWFRPSFLRQLTAVQTQTPSLVPLPPLEVVTAPSTELDPFNDKPLPIPASSTTTSVSNVDPTVISNRTVRCGSVPSATSQPLGISPLPALLTPIVSLEPTPPSTTAAPQMLMTEVVPQMLMTEVVPQMYNGGNVTEIPFIDEDTKRELFSLLGDWYEPESIESLFSSMPSDAVFFSS